VVLDEFITQYPYRHALALVRQLQQTRRSDLKLIVMSATWIPLPWKKYLEYAAVFDIKGKVFPVEFRVHLGANYRM